MTAARPRIVEIAMEVALPKEFLDRIAAESSPDDARHCAMSTSVGGIGPLLRERIFEQGDQGVDVIGVTLMYDTVWAQKWTDWGQVSLENHNVGNVLRKMMAKTDFGFELEMFDGEKVAVDVWELAYGAAKVYFLDAPKISDMVYPGPKDAPKGTGNPSYFSHVHRLKQSWLVGRGALALCKKMNRTPSIIVLSETPTFFGHHRLVKDVFQNDRFFDTSKYIFNDHTPLEYAHPIWDVPTLDLVRADSSLYQKMPAWSGERRSVDVTSWLIGASDGCFGVAKKHRRVMQAMPSLKNYASRIQSITNGVRLKDWQAAEWGQALTLSDSELIALRKKKRAELVEWAWRRFHLWRNWAEVAKERRIVLWTRRITPYKRLDTLLKLIKDPKLRARFVNLNVVMFIGGRIHQQDNHAQDIVYDMLDVISKDKEVESRVVFVDNFNVWEAPILFHGADATVMMADDTREASATGFMKAQMNGAVVIATADGAVPEFVKFENNMKDDEKLSVQDPPDAQENNGFKVPYINHEPTPLGLLEALEAFDAAMKDPAHAAKLIRGALAVTPFVDVARTVKETISFYEQVLAPKAEPAST